MTNQDTPAAGREDDAAFVRATHAVVTDYLDGYEFGDYAPNQTEQAMLEDFGEGLLAEIQERLRKANFACAPAPQPDAPEPVVWQYRMRMYGERYAWKDTTKEHAHLIDGLIWEIRRKPDDIVARLRAYRVLADRGGITSEVADPLMIEAADEIERLTRSGAGEVTEAMIQAGRRAWNECYSTDCDIVVRDILRAALAAAPSRADVMETPQQLLQKTEALLHDVDGDHADWAHALLHQAAAHLSDSDEIRSRAAEETPRMLDALREVDPSRGFQAGVLRAAEIAKAHEGASRRERETKGRKYSGDALAEIWTEEHGEDIASQIIAARIRAEAGEPPRDDGWEAQP